MKYSCQKCGNSFSASKKPKCCPFCLSEDVQYDGCSKKHADKLIEQAAELTAQIDVLLEQYKSLYIERECILNKLRSYKHRGVISDDEIPKIQRWNMQGELAELRRKRREEKKNETVA